MKKRFINLLSFGVMMACSIATTQGSSTLVDALKCGKVCEKQDGYIQATPGHESEIAALVEDVNAKRAQVYANIATERNLPTQAVATEMAKEERAANPGKFCR